MQIVRCVAWYTTLAALCGWQSVEAQQPKNKSLIAPNAQIQLLDDSFSFTEGPAADKLGNVFFTDQPNDRILKWGVDGQLTTFLQPCGRSNGLFFDHAGNLLACADERNELWSIAFDGKHTKLLEGSAYQGKRFNGPNDLWVHANGGIYFTDPFYKRPYWDRGPMEQEVQGVYYLPPNRQVNELARVASDLVQPNGIVGTSDGKQLYVADIRDRKTYVYEIATDGSLQHRRLFCESGSDGMTIDSQGNVYLTGKGVTVYDKHGNQIEQIDVDQNWTANVCFGGRDRKTLFITASKALYSLEMSVRGADEPVMTAK